MYHPLLIEDAGTGILKPQSQTVSFLGTPHNSEPKTAARLYELEGSSFQRSGVTRVNNPGWWGCTWLRSQGTELSLSGFPSLEAASRRQFAYSALQGREFQLTRCTSDLRLTGILQIREEPKARKNVPVLKKRQGRKAPEPGQTLKCHSGLRIQLWD